MKRLATLVRYIGLASTIVCVGTAISEHAPTIPLPFEDAVSFVPQLAVVAAITAVAYVFVKNWLFAVINAVALVALVWTIVPFLRLPVLPPRAQPAPGAPAANHTPFTIVHANVLYGNPHGERIVEFLQREKPLAAFLVELDDGLHKAIEPLHDLYPYRVPKDDEMPRHVQLLSQVPLEDVSVEYLVDPLRPVVSATVSIDGAPLRIVAVHLVAPVTIEKFALRNVQIPALVEYLRDIREPYVLVGDMNMTMWSPYYQSFVTDTGFVSSRLGRGILPSWYLFDPKLPGFGIPIDQSGTKGPVETVEVHLGPDLGSDHLPLVTTFRLTGGAEGAR